MLKVRGSLIIAPLALLLALSCAFSTATFGAESSSSEAAVDGKLDALLSAIRANRKALVAVNLKLTDDEASKFWPIYGSYQTEINAVGDRLVALIREYTDSFTTLSDDNAMKLVRDHLEVEAELHKVRGAYMEQFAKVLPGRTVARLYQIENKMDAIFRYDLAATVPVIEEDTEAPATEQPQ